MKRFARILFVVFVCTVCYCISLQAQVTNGNSGVIDVDTALMPKPVPVPPPVYVMDTVGFTTLESGLKFKIIKHGTGTRHPQVADHIEMHIHVHIKDSVMFDSRKMNNNKPVPFQVQEPTYRGDPIEGFMQLVAGDSALIRLPVDSILKQGKQVMPGMKEGDVQEYDMVLVSVMSDTEYKKDQFEKTSRQRVIDENNLKAYFKAHNIEAKRTESGIYYTVDKKGRGELVKAGQYASVNYTGHLLGDSRAFDSNTDPEFRHVEPYTVNVGAGGVIKGWDEGLTLYKKGGKGTLYIPSYLAYGSQDRSPTIPPNSILVFEIEIVKIMEQDAFDDKQIQKYLADKKINAKKTSTGLYYTIVKEGEGRKPLRGEKVVVRYTGTFMDGKKFDSNIDAAKPFTFTLGEREVITGWDEALLLMKKGTKATLFIPSGLAYGKQASTTVPANAILLFDVELVDIQKHD